MRKIALSFVACLFVGACVAGCNSPLFNQHAQLMDSVRGIAKDASTRLGESGFGQTAAAANAINPGVTVEVGIKYCATARYDGVAGQFTASQQGQLNRQVPDSVLAQADAVWRSTTLNAEAKRAQIMQLLQPWLVSMIESRNQPTTQTGG